MHSHFLESDQLGSVVSLIQDGPPRDVHSWLRGKKKPHRIRHTYPEIMKLGTVIPYLKKIQNKYKSRDTSFDFC